MANANLSKAVETRDKFLATGRKVYPLIQEIKKVLEESGLGDRASISVCTDGFTNFYISGCDWQMNTYSFDDTPKAEYKCLEDVIPLEEGA